MDLQYAKVILGYREVFDRNIGGDDYYKIISPDGRLVDSSRYGMVSVLKNMGIRLCDTDERRCELMDKIAVTSQPT